MESMIPISRNAQNPACIEPGCWPEFPSPDATDAELDAFTEHAHVCPFHGEVLEEIEEVVTFALQDAFGEDIRESSAPLILADTSGAISSVLEKEGSSSYVPLVFACLFVLMLIAGLSFYDAPSVQAATQTATPCTLVTCGTTL